MSKWNKLKIKFILCVTEYNWITTESLPLLPLLSKDDVPDAIIYLKLYLHLKFDAQINTSTQYQHHNIVPYNFRPNMSQVQCITHLFVLFVIDLFMAKYLMPRL